ncbi:MAG: hypothetical protein KDJ90_04780 [Nitratireductor sp.]|nr:hypothetical protein [Nitratireductor sp.]
MRETPASRAMIIGSGILAIVFGLVTIMSGGWILFGGPHIRMAAGEIVPFVLWFNFFAGFTYCVAGFGIWMRYSWSVWLSVLIAAATVLLFFVFGLYLLSGGAYEIRTVGALTLRSVAWISIALIVHRVIRARKS